MTDSSPDDARLRATEAQMRRALGLTGESKPRPQPAQPNSTHDGIHRLPRHFVKDREVPVTVIHRDESSGTNPLEAARQTIHSLRTAKERAERSLAEAQATIQQLQTQLAHERLAKDEVIQQAEADRQAVEQALASAQTDLAAERDARRRVEEELAAAHQEAEQQVRDMTAIQPAQKPSKPLLKGGAGRKSAKASKEKPVKARSIQARASAKASANARRLGRPPKAQQEGSEFVEWWKPGWKERLR